MKIAYIPVGVGTYELVTARAWFKASAELVKSLAEDSFIPSDILLTVDDLAGFLDGVLNEHGNPDLVIFQNITFANAAYVGEVISRTSCPVILWTLPEPIVDGTRLRMNSLTGAYSAASALTDSGRVFVPFYGAPDKEAAKDFLGKAVRAMNVICKMQGLKMSSVGSTPQGFGFGRALDNDLLFNFGIRLETVESRELMERARGYSIEQCGEELALLSKGAEGFEKVEKDRHDDAARLLKAYRDYIAEKGIGLLASRCWPDYFTAFGTPVCMILSFLNDLGICASCENDAYGAVSMFVASQLTGRSVFFGDPVYLDEEKSRLTFWHCGMAAPSLAQCPCIGVHPNRRIGPVMDFACKGSEKATILRIGRRKDGSFRIMAVACKALDAPKQFEGTSVAVELDDAKSMVLRTIQNGWEPHYVVAYGDIVDELKLFAKFKGLDFVAY